ncbi:hypothetical protein GGI12_001297 [Dipsacomyces acuminosporus]|nr:hypothetical protein GGI12_001297 [Dipsacomyces acuminosporus]
MDYTKCESASDFDAKFRTLLVKLDVVEGEETWQQIDNALKNLVSLVKAGAAKYDSFTTIMKQAVNFINNAALSERTRLSGTALALIEEMARQMETRFQPLCDLIFPAAIKICGRANKVFVTRGVNCLTTVITYAHIPDQTPRICEAATNDPNKTVRASAAKLLMSIVSCCTVPELTPHLALVEKAIGDGVVDANPDARTTARQSYEIYIKRFSNRTEQFKAGLSTTAKKYLKIDDKSADGRSQSQFASFRQRQPLRDRAGAQRSNISKASAAAGSSSSDAAQTSMTAATPAAVHRLKPIRPISRHTQGVANKDSIALTAATAAATTTAAAALGLIGAAPANASEPAGTSGAAAAATGTGAVPVKPAGTAFSSGANSVEQLLLSPRSTKPTLVRLFGEDPNASQSAPAAEKTRPDFAKSSVSPEDSGHTSRAPSPNAKSESSEAMSVDTKVADGPAVVTDKDVSAKTDASALTKHEPPKLTKSNSGESKARNPSKSAKPTRDERPASRAQRSHGLTFTSLNGGTGSGSVRTARAVRPQSRNLVSNRMEEALRTRPSSRQNTDTKNSGPAAAASTTRAQRPPKSASAASADPPKRMTLRSDSKPSYNLRTRSADSTDGSASVPGYLRATASSAKRVTGNYNSYVDMI